ncbi:hypothetical protein DUNSADRAFT_3726 [Dunaliella salina]|uniref:Uncharacterized protein n=1 Tax=Dunaliella salina TaxID=3046 RepID=A0ABQ7GTF6_DUNSA|nr:hypothetical protein DUNSADRAFT_3726 [Dunaliella salina]|eukprot:KAF5837893.1 hypothetical protein DUNSADRAFT_3726 [Dunaliella salina]
MVYAAPEQPDKTATAFRTAEKHFQHLFKTPHTSNARSRRRAQALQQAKCASADLTQQGVVDVRQPAAVAAGLEQGTLQRHVLPCAATLMGGAERVPAAAATISVAEDCNGSQAQYGCQPSHPPPSHASDQSVLAYTLPAHPGFVLLPALLPVAHQLQLMCDALTRFPEPPATTNHNRQYGPLMGIWVAAQSGLTLKLGRQPEKGASSNGDAHAEGDAYSHPVQLEHEQQQQQHEPSTRKFWDCWHRPLQLNGQGQQQSVGCACLDAQNGARKPKASAAAAGPAPALNHLQPSHTTTAPGIQADPTSSGPCAGQSYLDAQNGAQNTVSAAATTGRPAPALHHPRPQQATAAPSLRPPCTAFDHSTTQAPCVANDHNTVQAPTTAPSSTTAVAANTPAPTCSAPGGGAITGPSAASMLRRMRWASLGPQFDWTRRIYDDGAAQRQTGTAIEA